MEACLTMPSIGQDIPHDSAVTHVTGESVFLDDVAPLAGELLVGIVPSPVAHGKLCTLDLSAARAVLGVVCVLTHHDIPGHNRFGPAMKDEDLLVQERAVFLGQPLAVIGAESQEALERARKAAIVKMEELPPIFTIDEAVAANSFIGGPRYMQRGDGDIEAVIGSAAHVVSGEIEIGGQEHFYLESQVAIVVPGEQGQMTVHSSTQHPSEVQMMVAEVLGVPFNHVVCNCKRMGGGFGGKETQAAQPAMMAALVARHTGRPARFAYGKDDDMRFTGKRHPFKGWFKLALDAEGNILAYDAKLYSNGGCSTDLSFAVLERAMLHADSAYFIPHVRLEGRVCRTNLPSNTAFRGFGGPQGVAVIEHAIETAAAQMKIDATDLRQRNLYCDEGGRNVTHYGQVIGNNMLSQLFEQVRTVPIHDRTGHPICTFNESTRTHVRGFAVSPVKFGISFTRRTMNQANALVNVYQDGTVLVSTGATEMGQGVYTRVKQVVADALGVTYDSVLMSATSTDKNNNTSPTAASAGTDLNGAAALDACVRIRERLASVAAHMLARPNDGLTAEPSRVIFESGRAFDERAPQRWVSFRDVCCQAYEQRVSLGERGFYATPGVDFNRETGKGTPFLYYTQGVAAAEVEVDRWTGEMSVRRVDLIMDAGKPLNPGIDRGQVIGGFVQGMGWCTTEELVYGAKGQLLSNSPTTYKIPNVSDVPAVLNVRFLDNSDSDVSLHRSKAVGEPPLLLGLCVWLAAKDALRRAAAEAGAPVPALRLPATGEQMLLALESIRAAAANRRVATPTAR
jgi:xanthine dehydrogenase large subunit